LLVNFAELTASSETGRFNVFVRFSGMAAEVKAPVLPAKGREEEEEDPRMKALHQLPAVFQPAVFRCSTKTVPVHIRVPVDDPLTDTQWYLTKGKQHHVAPYLYRVVMVDVWRDCTYGGLRPCVAKRLQCKVEHIGGTRDLDDPGHRLLGVHDGTVNVAPHSAMVYPADTRIDATGWPAFPGCMAGNALPRGSLLLVRRLQHLDSKGNVEKEETVQRHVYYDTLRDLAEDIRAWAPKGQAMVERPVVTDSLVDAFVEGAPLVDHSTVERTVKSPYKVCTHELMDRLHEQIMSAPIQSSHLHSIPLRAASTPVTVYVPPDELD
jgi:hypothetical protein